MKANSTNHRLVTETETAQGNNIVSICTAEDILFDIKYLLKDFYTACFDKNESGLNIRFSNGQSFMIYVTSV